MESTYSIEDLIDMLEDLMSKATRLPLSNKSAIDIDKMSEIVTDMRMAIPMEIQHAQKVVLDKNNIIAEAKRDAETITRQAEQRREEILNESDIIKEAHRRANTVFREEQARLADMQKSTTNYLDGMLKRLEEMMILDINELRTLRSAVNGSQPVSPAAPPIQPVEKPGE